MIGAAATENGKYKLEEGLDRIVSPITLIFPDRTRRNYQNGKILSAETFDLPYIIKSIAAVDDEIGIILEEKK